ncbi:hypothetical protein P154DRAFT_581370 [Amniculicola lignicola CBS 123094]|uniref:Uncharacterized protein n=1 Tax=Amniculicola lignicola CBS 123094 TaxID=1392246 RepID=A0A6A5W1Z7_9PLEO|nr:hypothetical protein P154DRAFT_581370 [Amniculicola lignicola CBS 123094]
MQLAILPRLPAAGSMNDSTALAPRHSCAMPPSAAQCRVQEKWQVGGGGQYEPALQFAAKRSSPRAAAGQGSISLPSASPSRAASLQHPQCRRCAVLLLLSSAAVCPVCSAAAAAAPPSPASPARVPARPPAYEGAPRCRPSPRAPGTTRRPRTANLARRRILAPARTAAFPTLASVSGPIRTVSATPSGCETRLAQSRFVSAGPRIERPRPRSTEVGPSSTAPRRLLHHRPHRQPY